MGQIRGLRLKNLQVASFTLLARRYKCACFCSLCLAEAFASLNLSAVLAFLSLCHFLKTSVLKANDTAAQWCVLRLYAECSFALVILAVITVALQAFWKSAPCYCSSVCWNKVRVRLLAELSSFVGTTIWQVPAKNLPYYIGWYQFLSEKHWAGMDTDEKGTMNCLSVFTWDQPISGFFRMGFQHRLAFTLSFSQLPVHPVFCHKLLIVMGLLKIVSLCSNACLFTHTIRHYMLFPGYSTIQNFNAIHKLYWWDCACIWATKYLVLVIALNIKCCELHIAYHIPESGTIWFGDLANLFFLLWN